LQITPGEWQVFLDLFRRTLDDYRVPAAEQAELFAIVESTRKDIVLPPPPTG
jgi:hemoglobin